MSGLVSPWDDKQSPCVGCAHSTYCATNDAACIDFYRYVKIDDEWPDSKVRTPTKDYYTRIYRISGYERNRSGLNCEGSWVIPEALSSNGDQSGV